MLKKLVGFTASNLMILVSVGGLGALPFFCFIAVSEKSLVLMLVATVFGWKFIWALRVARELWWTNLHLLLEKRSKVSPEEEMLIIRAARIPWPLHRLNSPDPPRHF